MNERSILIGQIEALQSQLRLIEKSLDDKNIDSTLLYRVGDRFRNLIKVQQASLKQLLQDVEQQASIDKSWTTFQRINKDCRSIFRESLAFVEGSLVRSIGMDNGLCQLADAMLDDLSRKADIPWGRFTILAEGDLFVDLAGIIRLRFPEISIWNLPIAAHEFGHFVAQQTEVRMVDGIFTQLLGKYGSVLQNKGMLQARFLHEYYADIFATYALGPAYAYSCILLRFDPRHAYSQTKGHPLIANRVYIILKVLEEMDQPKDYLSLYRAVVENLRNLWQQSLQAIENTDNLDQSVVELLNELGKELYIRINTKIPNLKYSTITTAYEISLQLTSNDQSIQKRDDYTLRDILNAAWLYRIKHYDYRSVLSIGNRVMTLCENIVSRTRQASTRPY